MFTLSLLLRYPSGFIGREDVALVAGNRNAQNFSTFSKERKKEQIAQFYSLLES